MRRYLGVLAALASLAAPHSLLGQVRFQDLVFNLGGSVDGYSGNLSAVTVFIVDKTDHATAVVGEVGVRGALSLFATPTRSVTFSFDGGVRQAAAVGFQLRDYAPREWVGSTSARITQSLGTWGSLMVRGGLRGRSVEDRPPMPLFLQPGYTTRSGGLGLGTRPLGGLSFDAQADLEAYDYSAPDYLPQLALLDRSARGFEVGVRWGGPSTIRFYGGLRWTDYNNQGSFDPTDPFRRDHTARVGLEWTYPGDLFVQLGMDGTVNRSNSNRPEYDAVSVRALLTAPLPRDFSLNVYSVFTFKSYVHDSGDARLVPGEEADNASVAYLQIGHALASNLDGAIRFAWARAETDIGSAYYRRFGGSIQFNYRPLGN
ncbi:MAG TPA: hypothetical protein VJ997_07125 [Longimicrobiales bacterium]|nr:hypothetical protein [Longimicrobiales bacterium]